MQKATTMNNKRPTNIDINSRAAKSRRVVRTSDPNFEDVVTSWLDSESSSDSEADDIGDDYIPEHSDHNTDSNEEVSDSEHVPQQGQQSSDEDDVPLSNLQSYYGKNRYKWAKYPRTRAVRTPQHNIITRQSPSKLTENDEKDVYSIWKKFFDDGILAEVLKWTNTKIAQYRLKFAKENRPELQDLDIVELRAFLGLLMYSAVFKSNHENVDFLFATDGTGREIFRCVMSKLRFLCILHCLRFDNPADREERKQTDKLAAVSYMFNQFVSNCQAVYNVSECATVDEMLVAFRGRSYLIIYMPSKPSKYGLKLMCLCDAENGYFYNGYVYSGRGSDGESLSEEEKKLMVPTQSVIRLTKPLHGSNRNVTCDNWFTSIELIDCLKKRGLTCVGTVRKNKKEIPCQFLPSKQREEGSTLYGFTSQITLISHVPKKTKAVILASSMHHSEGTDERTGKPEIIAYYNSTKGGVDDMDKKCAIYTSSRRTRRWPMAIFYRLLDISTVNTYILYQSHHHKNRDRGSVVKELAHGLVLEHMQRRVLNMRLPRELRMTLSRVLGPDMPDQPILQADDEKTRKTCHTCPPKLNRKSTYRCYSCHKHVCLQCAKQVCPDCT